MNIENFLTGVTFNITQKILKKSITPKTIGDTFGELANLVKDEFDLLNEDITIKAKVINDYDVSIGLDKKFIVGEKKLDIDDFCTYDLSGLTGAIRENDTLFNFKYGKDGIDVLEKSTEINREEKKDGEIIDNIPEITESFKFDKNGLRLSTLIDESEVNSLFIGKTFGVEMSNKSFGINNVLLIDSSDQRIEMFRKNNDIESQLGFQINKQGLIFHAENYTTQGIQINPKIADVINFLPEKDGVLLNSANIMDFQIEGDGIETVFEVDYSEVNDKMANSVLITMNSFIKFIFEKNSNSIIFTFESAPIGIIEGTMLLSNFTEAV